MKRYTTLQYFKRQDYFDIVVAYNVAPGRFRESAEVKVPSQYIQDGRAGRYISKSFPGYLHAAEKINQLQDIVEQIVVAYVAKNEHKPDSDWLRAEFTRLQSNEIKETVVAPHAASEPPASVFVETQTVTVSPFNSRPPIQSVAAATVQLTPNPTHALAAKIVRSLNGGEVSPITPHQQANPVTIVSAQAIPVAESGDLFRFWQEFMVVRKVVRREDATFNELDSLRSTMEAFANFKNKVLNFGHLDQAFFVDLVHFLIYEYSYSINPLTMPIVGLRNETAMRRLRDLKTYVDYCVSENYLSLNIVRMERYILVARRKYGVKKLSGTQNWELAFCKEELEFVINLDYYEPEFYSSLSPTQRRYVDIIIFMCLQGTSPIDTMKLGRADIRNGLILKDRSKTDTAFKVEVHPISMAILERNNYCLDFNDTTFNRALKGIFVTVFELFRLRFGDEYERIYRRPYTLIERQMRKKGRTVVFEIKHKGLFVEGMTGRRTFLSLIAGKADEFGVKLAMEMAGHTKPTTTVGYFHPTEATGDRTVDVGRIQTHEPIS